MIKIENIEVYGWEAAIRGMRNPMNSWEKSDSAQCKNMKCENCLCSYAGEECDSVDFDDFVVGKEDMKLMKNLVAAGSDHSKFMRMINVTMDITAPLYWWKEFDTYKVGTVRNSCSTMHKIHSKKFSMEDFSVENFVVDEYLTEIELSDMFVNVIADCEELRQKYNETGDKKYWRGLIQLLPSSYNQRATVQVNYAVLRNMYHARKNHKLDEWRLFCRVIDESFPYSKLITMESKPKLETRWIPCSERMPEGMQEVLVFTELQKVEKALYNCAYKSFDRLASDGYRKIGNVIHWMPLPEPPEESK